MAETIWTPYLSEVPSLSISLDRDFAKKMIQLKIPTKRQIRMKELASEDLKKQFGINCPNPYRFYEDSGFISQFHIDQNGVWLSIDYQTRIDLLKGKESSKAIEYDSHNVDHLHQSYALMFIFGKWIEYSDTF